MECYSRWYHKWCTCKVSFLVLSEERPARQGGKLTWDESRSSRTFRTRASKATGRASALNLTTSRSSPTGTMESRPGSHLCLRISCVLSPPSSCISIDGVWPARELTPHAQLCNNFRPRQHRYCLPPSLRRWLLVRIGHSWHDVGAHAGVVRKCDRKWGPGADAK